MSRFVLTLGCIVLFCVYALTACSASDLFGNWEGEAAATYATPSYLGQTGLIVTPTAMIQPELKGAIFYHKIQAQPRRQDLYGATIGLPLDLEVSVLRVVNLEPLTTEAPDVWRQETLLNAKWQVPLGEVIGNPLAPKLAVGVFDVSNLADRTWYGAISRSFSLLQDESSLITLHLGYAKKDHGGGRLDGLFGGFDAQINKQLVLQAEYDAEDLNGGLRYYPIPSLSLDGSVIGGNFGWGATTNNAF